MSAQQPKGSEVRNMNASGKLCTTEQGRIKDKMGT